MPPTVTALIATALTATALTATAEENFPTHD
jgi:hypothetical protein